MSSESHEKKYDEKGQNDVTKWPSHLNIKMCTINLRKLKINFKEDSNSDDDELPPLPFSLSTSRSTRKSRKNSKDLKEEFENLAKDITADNICENNIKEKLDKMEVVEESFEVEEEDSLCPPLHKEEPKEFKLFCANEYFQYFNFMDITLLQCGYRSSLNITLLHSGYRSSLNHSNYEEELLSVNRCELEHVLSSFLYSCNVHCVSDCKSFATYLLKNLSVHADVGCVETCFRVLESLLQKHPDAYKLTFSSAEIFMLLFNYGTDIQDLLTILPENSDLRKEPTSKKQVSNKVPQSWTVNLMFLLDAIMCLFEVCKFESEDLCSLTLFFLYMTLDPFIAKENLIPNLNKLVFECLDLIPKTEWPKTMNKIASTFISMEFSSSKEKWSNILHIAQSMTASSARSLELRRYISFLALKHLGRDEPSLLKGSKDIAEDLSETLNISEVESLLEWILTDQKDPELISFGVKFLDICISHLKASDEDFEKLCKILKHAESALNKQAYEAKANFVKMHAKLKIHLGKNSFYKVAPEKTVSIKKEIGTETEKVPCSLDFVKIKKEPGLESSPPSMIETNDEKIIRISDFNLENDDSELDFDSIGKDISKNNATSSVKENKIIVADQTISADCLSLKSEVPQNLDELNIVSDVETKTVSQSPCLPEDNTGGLPVIACAYSVSKLVESNDAVTSNSIQSNSPLLESGVSIKVESTDTEIESPMLDVTNEVGEALPSDNMCESSKMDITVRIEDSGHSAPSENLTDSVKSSKQLDPVIINVDQIPDISLLAKSLQSNNPIEESSHSVKTDKHPDSVFFTSITSLDNQTGLENSSKQLDPVVINIGQASNDVSVTNTLTGHSETVGSLNRDAVFPPAVTKQPDVYAQLVESLALPKGTEISPVKTDALQPDFTRQRKPSLPHLPGVASGEISMTIIQDEITIVEEVDSSPKHKKSKKRAASESDDLQVLVCKPVSRSSKSKKTSSKQQDKLSGSKSSDEDVTILTEIHKNSDDTDCFTLSVKGPGNNNLPSASKESKSKSNNIPDDDGVVYICHVDSPSKSKISESENAEIASKNSESLSAKNSPSRKSKNSKTATSPTSNTSLSGDERNVFPTENNQDLTLDSEVQTPIAVQNDLEIIDGEVAVVMNEDILTSFVDLANDPETSGFQAQESSISSNKKAVDKEVSLKNIDVMKEDFNDISGAQDNPVKTVFVEERILVSEVNKDKNAIVIKTIAESDDFPNEDFKEKKPSETLFVDDVSEVIRQSLKSDDVKDSDIQNKDSGKNNVLELKSDKTLHMKDEIIVSEVNGDKCEKKIEAENKDLSSNGFRELDERPLETVFVEDGMLVSEVDENKPENNNEVDAENCHAQSKDAENNLLSEKPATFFEGDILVTEPNDDKSENFSKIDAKNYKEKKQSENIAKVNGKNSCVQIKDPEKNGELFEKPQALFSKEDTLKQNVNKSKNINETSPKISSIQNEGILVPEVNACERVDSTTAKNNNIDGKDTEENNVLSEKLDETDFKSGQTASCSEDIPKRINKSEAKKIVTHKDDFVEVTVKLEEIITRALDKKTHSEFDKNEFGNSNIIKTSIEKEFEPNIILENTQRPKAKKSFKRKFSHEVSEKKSSRPKTTLKDSDRQRIESVQISVSEETLDEKDKTEKIYKRGTEKDFKAMKKVQKRKSIHEDIENKRSKTKVHSDIEKDASCVLNNLLELSVEMINNCDVKSSNHDTSCDKSLLSSRANNCVQEPENCANYNIRNDRIHNTVVMRDETRTFQYKSSANVLNLKALIDSKKRKASKPNAKTKISSGDTHLSKEGVHLKTKPHRRKSSGLSSPKKDCKESSDLSTNHQKYAATDNDLQLIKIAKRNKTNSPLKFSPRKSSLSPKSLKNSPSKYFDYKQKRSNYCAFSKTKKNDLLTQTGLNLKNILRDKMQTPALPSHFEQNSFESESYILSDSDSDVMELYVDPKCYRDKECLVTYESEPIVVIDSD